jgi:hypothetical protein
VPGNGARPSLTSQEGMAALQYAAVAVGCSVLMVLMVLVIV